MRKILLIGQGYPYKGGITHYTSLLYWTLVEKYGVEMISYKMYYPRFLFKKEQKDHCEFLYESVGEVIKELYSE